MDFITWLPKPKGKNAIFVVVDRLTKYAHFCGIQSTNTTSQEVEVFMKEIHRLCGLLKLIIDVRDPKFT
jgi:hypothetical protein